MGYSGSGDTACVDINGCSPAVNSPQPGSASPCYPGVLCRDVPAVNVTAANPGAFTCGPCPLGTAGSDGITCFPCPLTVSIPITTMAGGQLRRGDPVSLYGSVAGFDAVISGFPCNSAGGLSFLWTVAANGSVVQLPASISTSSPTLSLPPRTLPPDASALFLLSACYAGLPGQAAANVCGSATISAFVYLQVVTAQLTGGNCVVGNQNTVVLDASRSFDQDGDPAAPLLYSWQCFASDTGLQDASCSGGLAAGAAVQSLLLPGSAAGRGYSLVVTVSASPPSAPRSSVANTNLTVLIGNSPVVSIAGPPTSGVNPALKLSMQATVSSYGGGGAAVSISSTLWTLESGALIGRATLQSPGVALTPLTQAGLVLAPNVLLPGTFYRLRLTATASGGVGSATVAFSTADAPHGNDTALGSLSVSPASGSSMSTQFLLQASNWVAASNPLQYLFAYVSAAANGTSQAAVVILRPYSPSPTATVQLPAGSAAAGYIQTVMLFVKNADGVVAATPVTFPVAVTSPLPSRCSICGTVFLRLKGGFTVCGFRPLHAGHAICRKQSAGTCRSAGECIRAVSAVWGCRQRLEHSPGHCGAAQYCWPQRNLAACSKQRERLPSCAGRSRGLSRTAFEHHSHSCVDLESDSGAPAVHKLCCVSRGRHLRLWGGNCHHAEGAVHRPLHSQHRQLLWHSRSAFDSQFCCECALELGNLHAPHSTAAASCAPERAAASPDCCFASANGAFLGASSSANPSACAAAASRSRGYCAQFADGPAPIGDGRR